MPPKSNGDARKPKPAKPVSTARPPRSGPVRALRLAATALIWLVALGAAVIAYFAYDMPEVGRLTEAERRPSITLVDARGQVLLSFGDIYGEQIQVRDLPDYLPKALLATEDRRFFEHGGLDPWGMGRALVVNLRAGRVVQGGSTITQQLAKNLFLNPERTIRRKVQETLLALWLEQRYTKEQILTIYLNRVYFGAGTYGVDAAARRYFGKSPRQLTLYESAMLAGLLKAPSRYNPSRDGDLSARRTDQVLANMVDAGFITGRQAEIAKSTRPQLAYALSGQGGRYFGDWVLDQVSSFVGYPDRDLIVVTTMDAHLQRVAEAKLSAVLAAQGPNAGVSQGALLSMSPDGAVRAMVGGRDYSLSQFNRATQALRQPGSAFKTFVYLAALERGMDPTERMVDTPISVEGWSPRNFDNKYRGEVSLREAFAQSLNSVAVQVSERAGRRNVVNVARRLGITADLKPMPSIALGTSEVTLIELTQAYAAFANMGNGVWAYGIEEIRDREGRVLYKRQGSGPGRVIEPRQLAQMDDMMMAVVSEGTGRAAQIGRPAAGKTGTSQDFRDAWFVGFTAELVTGVWFGNDDGAPMRAVSGGRLPAALWHEYMATALEGQPVKPLPMPAAVPVAESGGVPLTPPEPGERGAQPAGMSSAPAGATSARPSVTVTREGGSPAVRDAPIDRR